MISTLVSIYDSKDLFVKELQVLLAQRLLAITDDNFDKVEKEVRVSSLYQAQMLIIWWQRRNIEILKIRFGEAALQVCEVMLKDMTDSKRIDGHVQSQKAVSAVFCLSLLMLTSSSSRSCTRPLSRGTFGPRSSRATLSCRGSFKRSLSEVVLLKK